MSHTVQHIRAFRFCFALVAFCAVIHEQASGEFSTVYNVPPDEAPGSISSDTLLNLFEEGLLPSSVDGPFEAGSQDGTSTNVRVDVMGGTVGSFFHANGGSEVNISGGLVGAGFNALRGSVVNISGGTVGVGFSAFDSSVNITGGNVGDAFTAGINSTVNISGGIVGRDFLTDGGVVNITGGMVGLGFRAAAGVVNISGGEVESRLEALDGSEVNVTGGAIEAFFDAKEGSTVNFSGGSLGLFFDALAGSTVNVFGSQFFLNDDNLENLLTPNEPFPIDARNVTLSGVLSDDSPFELELNDERIFGTDFFSTDAVLTVTWVLLLGDYNDNGVVDAADYNVWRDTFGSESELAADGNRNGVIDAADYNIWRDNFGNMAGASVPESTSVALLLTGAFWLVIRSNRLARSAV